MRYKIAKICFMLASVFKGLGRLVINKKRISVDALTLPGWFILDNHIIFQRVINSDILKNGFEWLTWPMPKQWRDQMEKRKYDG